MGYKEAIEWIQLRCSSSRRFGRFTATGVFNTVFSYIMFVCLSSVVGQVAAFFATEVTSQTIKYFLYRRFVYRERGKKRRSAIRYIIATIPYSFAVFINVYLLSRVWPAYLTGIAATLLAILYYKVYARVFRRQDT